MVKFSKNLLFNPAKIRVSGLKCNLNNIVKMTNVFVCKWIVVTVDSVTEGSPLLAFMKEQRMSCFVRTCSAGYVEVSAVIPYALFEVVLEKAIDEEPENIFVLNLLDSANCAIHFQHSFEELVIAGVSDVFISISLVENAMLICVNKSSLSPQEILKKIKALQFE